MEISPKIEIVNKALWLKKESTIIINDIHLGYEEHLHRKGVLVPHFQLNEISRQLEEIIDKTNPKRIIINGDLKHEFGKVLKQEWNEVLAFLDLILRKKIEVIIIKGNHDPIIKPITDKRGIKIVSKYQIKEVLIVHGDEIMPEEELREKKAKIIIIGHEHPAIILRHGSKWEKYKCFLKGIWKNKRENKELIVVPSFNPLLEGTDILKEKLLSPYLKNLADFNIFVLNEGEVFDFGKLKNVVQKMK